ncbi:DUF262 domain-containing protein [Clostridium sp. Marseille-P2415]|uniref:DUF262 domain-containing protein n=1 Tax=Clostridium sp. Marseille-P2415 TaxID=1805471 RepID=UPI0013564730|nr:DUF262 domain-containing protein [Clostridium sp. Marseille-P2415]
MKNGKGNVVKLESEVIKSAQQISEKKQDIKFDTRDYVINYLIQQYESGNFYIPLEYQRNFIWGDKEKCFFIESILMGLPIPFMFFADTDDGRIEIVDGAQRTQTLVQFAQNDLELNDLKILTDSNGFKFEDFDPAIQRRFLNTNIRVVFLEEGTTEKVRQEIFKRINTGGIPATPTETRRGSFEGEFKNFLEECVKNKKFNKLAPRTKLTEDRYEGFELVSRFFAYVDNYNNDFIGYNGNVTEYIDNYIDKQNKSCETNKEILDDYKQKFENMLDYAELFLGARGFRKTISSKSTPRARFEALAIGISLAIQDKPDLEVKDASWIDEDEFSKRTKSDAANNKSKLIGRIQYVKDKLLMGE